MQHWFRFSIVTVCFAACSCAWFIPPEKNAPRYNSVLGESRRPEMNPASDGVPEVAVREPVSIAPQVITPLPVVEAQPLPPMAEPVARRVPMENPGNTREYPTLSSVPHVGDEEDAERLARVRAQLEEDRVAAMREKSQLTSESTLQPMPTRLPVATPQPMAPLPVMPSVAPIVAPSPVIAPRYVPPPVVSSAPPTVTAPMPLRAPAPVYQSTAPAPVVSPQEPIVLRAPQAAPMSSYSRYNESTANPAAQPLRPPAAGGFDPLAGGQVPAARYNNSYLPPSRYYQDRGY